MRAILILALATHVSAAGRIVGGRPVGRSTPLERAIYDSTVNYFAVFRDGIGECTGVVVMPDIILTAAHCLRGKSKFKVFLGHGAQMTTVETSKIAIHKRYSGGREPEHDLGLLLLTEGTTRGLQTPAPVDRGLVPERGLKITAAGYGTTNPSPGSHEGKWVLNMVDLTVSGAMDDHFSADEAIAKGACHGDSGGPAFTLIGGKPFLVGIISTVSAPYCGDGTSFQKLTGIDLYGDFDFMLARE